MTTIAKYIVVLFGLFLLGSCGEDFFETTLEVDPPAFEKRLAIHAFGTTRTNDLRVLVTESYGLLDNDNANSLIFSATIKLFKNGSEVYELDPLPHAGQSYDFNYIMPQGIHDFEIGALYQLVVEAPGFPRAVANAIVPNDNDPLKVEFEEDAGSGFDDDGSSGLNVTFQDKPIQSDFYELQALMRFENNGNPYYEWGSTDSFDPATIYGLDNLLFADDSFDGVEKTIELLINEISLPQDQDDLDRLYLNWRVVSEDHYLFNRTAQSFIDNNENPFSSPIQVYSNFENGLGIFSIVNESFIKVN